MTKSEFLFLVELNNSSNKVVLGETDFCREPNKCGIVEDGLFFLTYITSEKGNVEIMLKTKDESRCYIFLSRYLGFNKKNGYTLKNKKRS